MNDRRFTWVKLTFLAGLILVMVRLVDLVFIKGETYLRLATANRFWSEPVKPARGLIYDRFGQSLAFNRPRYYFNSQPQTLFPPLKPMSRLDALMVMATDSARVERKFERHYLVGPALAQTVGFLAKADKEDLASSTLVGVDDWVGRIGLEARYDTWLHGRPGEAVYEVDALGRKKRVMKQVPAQAGHDLKTTLSADLSREVYRALTDKVGAVVVLNVADGSILSLVSSPSFNPNSLTESSIDPMVETKRQASISAWLDDERKPFFNRAIAGTYPPGSTFKLVTALAGLESGKLDANRTVNDQGVLRVGEYEFNNWYYTQYGRVEGEISLVRAIARSNDIYFYKVAEWTGADVIANLARTLGLGQPTGVELSGEAKGLVPDPAWKSTTSHERWYLGNTYHLGIGQGDTLVTPIQLASVVQTIASDGRHCRPHLVIANENYCSELQLNSDHVQLILEGMIQACSPGGTGYPFFEFNRRQLASLPSSATTAEKLQAGAVACKTGTAEFGPALNDQGFRATHAWFVAYVDLSQLELRANLTQLQPTFPRQLVIVVLVESDSENQFKEGSADAAPVAKQILEWILGQDGHNDHAS